MIRETITLWNEAVVSYDQGDYDKALSCLEKIVQPTAKIFFDMGCVYLTRGSPNMALESFARTIQKDEHLAVGYFQHGVAAFKVNRITDAIESFQKAYFYLRGHSVIDYRQLGLTVLLYAAQVLLNLALCLCCKKEWIEAVKWLRDAESIDSNTVVKTAITRALAAIQKGEEFKLQELPAGAIFRPAKAVVSNLEKRDFLGKAKVVAALDQNDTFTGFAGPRKHSTDNGSPPSSSRVLTRQNSRSLEDLSRLRTQSRLSPSVSPRISPRSPKSPSSRPPPPGVPPPRLPNRKYVLVQNSQSAENLASNGCLPIDQAKSPRNSKTDVNKRPATVDRHAVSMVHENCERKEVRCEAPKRPPKTYSQLVKSEADLKPKHINGRTNVNVEKDSKTPTVVKSDSEVAVSSRCNLKVCRRPPSRPPPQLPSEFAPQCVKTSISTRVNRTTVALYNYNGSDENQLSFGQGEIITVLEEVEESWFQGRLRGKIGLVPWTYVQCVEQKRNIFH